MEEIRLSIHGGGRLEVRGSLAAERLVVLLSRESFFLDDALVSRMSDFFFAQGLTVVRYESRSDETLRLIDRPFAHRLPFAARQGLKALQLLVRPARWAYFSPSYRARVNSIANRGRALRELVGFLGPGKEVMIVGRSLGGRVATMVADEAKVAKLVCLGYPFRHPRAAPDPGRYAHLANLQTPLLIVQGTSDPYGGREITVRYQFSPNTRIHWVETGHDFAVSTEVWTEMLERVMVFFSGE